MTQTITLNPDGRGKVKIEIVTPAFDFDMSGGFGGPAQKKKKSLDEIKKDVLAKFVSETPGVTAFKDVTAKWTREGKLQLVGTAYFQRLEDLSQKPAKGAFPVGQQSEPTTKFQQAFQLTINKDSMRITTNNEGVKEGLMPFGDNEPPPDVTKMTDQEIDDYLLRQRVEYQKIRPLLELMFNDLKVTTVIHLPGDVTDAKGFKKDGRTVSQSLEGRAVMDVLKKVILMDRADFKKLADAQNEKAVLALIGPLAEYGKADVTVTNLGQPLFDYEKEVREAREAYPVLRKSLGLDAATKLPGQ
jgi:hypothetical protein